MAKPCIPDIQSLIQAGINPKTGLPLKLGSMESELKTNIKKLLRIKDEQDAINRYTWYNLPKGLNGQLMERILYYRGQAMFFYMETDGNFYFLPYALDGTIDVYGRFTSVTPVPFNGTAQDKEQKAWIQGLTKKVEYEAISPEELEIDNLLNSCVLLNDYSNQISQTNISRQVLMDPLLDVMSDCIPFARTSLLNSTGVQGMKVETEDEYTNVAYASKALDNAALNGQKWVPIVGHTEFQQLTEGTIAKPQDFMLTMQSLDNFRQSLYGLENGGIFQKKEHMLGSEMAMNASGSSLSNQDGLTLRQRFCTIINSIWGLGMWCEKSENVTQMDTDGNGAIGDEETNEVNQGQFEGGNSDDNQQ